MTYRDYLATLKIWHRRVLVIDIYHHKMLLRNKKWNQRFTAKKLGISLGNVNEAIKLAKKLKEDSSLKECKTRQEALERIK